MVGDELFEAIAAYLDRRMDPPVARGVLVPHPSVRKAR
jgi:hypothetical protein